MLHNDQFSHNYTQLNEYHSHLKQKKSVVAKTDFQSGPKTINDRQCREVSRAWAWQVFEKPCQLKQMVERLWYINERSPHHTSYPSSWQFMFLLRTYQSFSVFPSSKFPDTSIAENAHFNILKASQTSRRWLWRPIKGHGQDVVLHYIWDNTVKSPSHKHRMKDFKHISLINNLLCISFTFFHFLAPHSMCYLI